jgi:hypothetical protein
LAVSIRDWTETFALSPSGARKHLHDTCERVSGIVCGQNEFYIPLSLLGLLGPCCNGMPASCEEKQQWEVVFEAVSRAEETEVEDKEVVGPRLQAGYIRLRSSPPVYPRLERNLNSTVKPSRLNVRPSH